MNGDWKPKVMDPKEVRYYVWGWNYTDERKPAGLLGVTSGGGLGGAYADVGSCLEFKDRETAKEFAKLCKPLIVKHLFGQDDHENFGFNF